MGKGFFPANAAIKPPEGGGVPERVVAKAVKPIDASSRADPTSHGLGSNNGFSPWWSARNVLARVACSGLSGP